MISLRRYSAHEKLLWDSVIETASNGHFMFKRDYMDYHADRFFDYSFMVLKDHEVIGVIPGNKNDDIWHSHQGLTFGGVVLKSQYNRTAIHQKIFYSLFSLLKTDGFKSIIYKYIPHIYHASPCEGDLYALHQFSVEHAYIEVSTSVDLRNSIKPSQLRLRGRKKAEKAGLTIQQADDLEPFWNILSKNLAEKYNKKPVHSIAEIKLLHSRFPENIKLFVAVHPTQGVCAGTVIYDTKITAHAQYISSNDTGQEMGALDLLFLSLIDKYREQGYRFFDFGISTEEKGSILNEPLISFKEGFGGGGVTHIISLIRVK